MKHTHPLLEREAAPGIGLDQRLVSHEKSAHELKGGNLNGEVEGSDNTHWTKRPSVTSAELTLVVAWNSECLGEEPDLVSAKVLEELASDADFGLSLEPALWNTPLHKPHEVVENGRIVEHLGGLSADLSEHKVAFFVLKGVVETMLGDCFEGVNEGIGFFSARVGHGDHRLAGERVDQIEVLRGGHPLAVDQVHALIFCREVFRVEGCKRLQVSGEGSGLGLDEVSL